MELLEEIEEESEGEGEIIDPSVYQHLRSLPPRVVIFDILSMIVMKVDEENKPFDLFGFFSRDQLRYKWYLFLNLEVGGFVGVINLEKLRFLRINNFSFFRDIIQHSPLLKNLNSLHVVYGNSRRRDYPKYLTKCENEFFSHPQCFPVLETLSVVLTSGTGEKWSEYNTDLWNRLTSLTLHGKTFKNRDFFIGVLQNIRFLSISYLDFDQETIVNVPTVEDVRLTSCYNLRIIPGSKLRVLTCVAIQEEATVHEIYRRSPNLEHLRLHFCGVGEEDPQFNWLLDTTVNPLMCLKSVTLYMVKGFEGTNRFSSFGPNCETVRILNCHQLQSGSLFRNKPTIKNIFMDDDDERRYSKLRVLELLSLGSFTPWDEWKFMKHIRELSMSDFNFTTCQFFQINWFDDLVKLRITNSIVFDGTSPSTGFPNLKELELRSLPELLDTYFQHDQFKSLESLSIYCCRKLQGIGWSMLPNLMNFQEFECSLDEKFWMKIPFSESCKIVSSSFNAIQNSK